jgi:hypothetical protein
MNLEDFYLQRIEMIKPRISLMIAEAVLSIMAIAMAWVFYNLRIPAFNAFAVLSFTFGCAIGGHLSALLEFRRKIKVFQRNLK